MKASSRRVVVQETLSICISALRGLDTELSHRCADFLEKGDHASYLLQKPSFDVDCWRTFFRDYQAVELLSKFDGLTLPGVNREVVAIDKFLASEKNCRAVNERFQHFYSPGHGIPSELYAIYNRARVKIERILGSFSWDEAVPFMAFGPGASIGLTRKRRHPWYKFGSINPTSTGENAAIAELLIGSSPQWSKTVPVTPGIHPTNLLIVRGSRITTVPKNAKTNRVIAVEPLMNMFVQKGIGGVIRRRLKGVGIDLNDQTRNQILARKGSISGLLATIDLASASDSISRGLVEWLLPSDWVTAMKICRSSYSVLPSGEEIFLQKFSSMGNGYTFELESLIFWALSSACLESVGESSRDLSVYGDDIIVPCSVVPVLIPCLSYVGFETNVGKSFWEGPFRESCGKHYFLGHDVTPLYVRKDVGNAERKLWLANSIRRLAYRMMGLDYGCCARLRSTYDMVCRKVDRRYVKLSIPDGFGDGGLVRDFDEARPHRHRFFDGFVVQHLQRRFATFSPSGQPALTLSLFNKGGLVQADHTDPYADRMSLRDFALRIRYGVPFEVETERFRYGLVKTVVPLWGDLGPWCSTP
jgi:hypothetical protein